MQCPACGVEVVPGGVFCHQCGQRLDGEPNEFPQDSRPADHPATSPAEMLEQAAASGRQAPDDQPEEEIWRGGYSSKAMIGGWVIAALVSLALLAGGILWAKTGWWWLAVLLAMLLPWLYFFSILCYRRMSVRYRLTTQRFVHEHGILRRVNDRIEVLDMDDITTEQGFLERLVGVGTIRILSSDRSHPDLALPGIENVKVVAERFDNARRNERRRRGLHIEQI